MKKNIKLPETEDGTILFNIDPIIIKQHYEIDYIHSYAQDSPFFAGLTKKKLLGSRCADCGYTYATPRGHCMECGAKTEWFELPLQGRIHTFTTCYFGSEAFLKETPFTLILVEFEGVNTLFLSRLVGIEPDRVKIGMKVKARFLRNCKFKPTDVYFVPAIIIEAPEIPYTFNMKKVESAVANIIHGRAVTNRDALINPESLDFYEEIAHELQKE